VRDLAFLAVCLAGAEWVAAPWQHAGISYLRSEHTKSEIYL
jgi:hypothetical protein